MGAGTPILLVLCDLLFTRFLQRIGRAETPKVNRKENLLGKERLKSSREYNSKRAFRARPSWL